MVDLTRLGGKMSPYNYPFMRLIKDDTINTFISSPHAVPDPPQPLLESIMRCETQETIASEIRNADIHLLVFSDSVPVDIELGKTLNINPNLSPAQSEQLLKILREQK